MKKIILIVFLVLNGCASNKIFSNIDISRVPAQISVTNDKSYECFHDADFKSKSDEIIREINEKILVNGKEISPTKEGIILMYNYSRRDGPYDILVVGRRDDTTGRVNTSRYCRLMPPLQ